MGRDFAASFDNNIQSSINRPDVANMRGNLQKIGRRLTLYERGKTSAKEKKNVI
jgi:hypothetical protein